MPGTDAPLEVLARYWAQRMMRDGTPDETTKWRLLEAAEADPSLLTNLLDHLPDSPSAHDRVKAILDTELQRQRFGVEWQQRIRQHLMFHSRYFRTDLIQSARAAHDEDSSPKGADELAALGRLDWRNAEPILQVHAQSTNARVRAIALGLLYEHAPELYRSLLIQIVEDKNAPGRARDAAAEVLLTSQWDGRDAWYLSLFRDPTLRELHDGYMMMTPLCSIDMDPDRWIRMLSRMVGSRQRSVHDGAVSCLVGFQLDRARRDALLPLLPWLKDPKWSSARDRLRLIQSMDRVEMPEAIPGLIAVLDQNDEYDRSYAAESLAHYRDPRAVPALRRALSREEDWAHRMRIIQALVACDGVTGEQSVEAVEALARQIATERGGKDLSDASFDRAVSKRIAPPVMIGLYLAQSKPPAEATVERLLERARRLEAEQPAVAKALLGLIHQWPARSSDSDLVKRIAEGRADAAAIRAALLRRESLRKTVGPELATLAGRTGTAAGVAAALLGDRGRQTALLEGNDAAAQRALLAGARLIGAPLEIARVGRLFDRQDALLTVAAEAYLEAEDSPAARQLVTEHHRGEARIIGARQGHDPGHNTPTLPLTSWRTTYWRKRVEGSKLSPCSVPGIGAMPGRSSSESKASRPS